jgi:hypothetical protein
MKEKEEIITIIPVLPSADIARDTAWYKDKMGFEIYFSDAMYAVLYRAPICFHLQWHADTATDPLLGGSVVRILVNDINPFYNEFIQRETISTDALKLNTPWQTNEFGFFDLNRNAIFFMENVAA